MKSLFGSPSVRIIEIKKGFEQGSGTNLDADHYFLVVYKYRFKTEQYKTYSSPKYNAYKLLDELPSHVSKHIKGYFLSGIFPAGEGFALNYTPFKNTISHEHSRANK